MDEALEVLESTADDAQPTEEATSTDPFIDDGIPDNDSLFGDVIEFAEGLPDGELPGDEEDDEDPEETPSDEEAETPESETPEADPDAEPSDEETPSDEDATALPQPVLKDLGTRLGTVFNEPTEVVEHVTQMQERLDGFGALDSLMGEADDVRAFIEARANGKTPEEAIRALMEAQGIDLMLDAPDPELEPQKYGEYMRKKGEQTATARAERAEADRQAQIQDRTRKSAERAFQATVQRLDMSKEEAKGFAQEVAQVLQGDLQTGRVRTDTFDIIHKGLNHDALLAEAVKQAKVEGRNEAIEEMKAAQKGKGDGLPLIAGGGKNHTSADIDPALKALGAGEEKPNIHKQF